jgi:hypothetical protein
MHSEGNNVAYDGIKDIIKKVKREKLDIKINILSLNSPSFWGTIKYSLLAAFNPKVNFQNFWGITDPISWPSLPTLSPTNQPIFEGLSLQSIHVGSLSHPKVRQTALAMATGAEVPLATMRSLSLTLSDQYFLSTLNMQQQKIIFSPGTSIIKTQMQYSYQFGRLQRTIPTLPIDIGTKLKAYQQRQPKLPSGPNRIPRPNLP